MKNICENCWMEKSAKGFYRSASNASGLSLFCRACTHTLREHKEFLASGSEAPLTSPVAHLLVKFPSAGQAVRREIAKYNAAYLCCQWEACIIYIGRAAEALVYGLAAEYHLETRLPKNSNLSKIQAKQADIRSKLSEASANKCLTEHNLRAIQNDVKQLVTAALDFNSQLNLFLFSSETEQTQDYKYSLLQIEKHIMRTGQSSQRKAFFDGFKTGVLDIMKTRNSAAHSPKDLKRKTFRKSELRNHERKLAEVISITQRFPAVCKNKSFSK